MEQIELERYQCYELLENRFNDWTKQAKEDFQKTWSQHNLENSILAPSKIDLFITSLDIFKYKIFSEIAFEATTDSKKWIEIFKKKMNDLEQSNWLANHTLQNDIKQ